MDLFGINFCGLTKKVVTKSIEATSMKVVAIDCFATIPNGIKSTNPQTKKKLLTRSAIGAILSVPLIQLIVSVGLFLNYFGTQKNINILFEVSSPIIFKIHAPRQFDEIRAKIRLSFT